MEKDEDFKIKTIDEILSNIFRKILHEEIDYIVDDDIIELLRITNNEKKYKIFKNIKYYGRYLIKREREY